MRFIDGAILLTIFTAILYCASNAYTHGLLFTLGADKSVDRDFHTILYHGMILSFNPVLKFSLIVFAFSLLRSLIIVALKRINKNYPLVATKINSCYQHYWPFQFDDDPDSLEREHTRLNIKFLVWPVLIIIFLVYMTALEKDGQDAAKKLLTEIASQQYREVNVPSINKTGLAYLYCGTTQCLAMDVSASDLMKMDLDRIEETTSIEIVYFPQDEMFITYKHKPSSVTPQALPATP